MRPDPSTALLLIAHGSRNPLANLDLVHIAESFRNEGFPKVEVSYLELAPPDIQEGGSACVVPGINTVLMLPYFLSAGVHVRQDLEEARKNLESSHPGVSFILAKPLGPHPQLVEILKLRGDEALTLR